MPKGRPSCSRCGGKEYALPKEACEWCEDIGAQAEDWIKLKCPPSVSGNGGHAAAFAAACALVRGFCLQEGPALSALRAWNALCAPPWSEGELLHKVREAAKSEGQPGGLIWKRWGGDGKTGRRRMEARPPLPDPERREVRKNRLDFDLETLRAAQSAATVDRAWLQARSVCPLATVTPEAFLSALYAPGSRVLVFTRFASQGQYLWQVPGGPCPEHSGAWRLGRTPQEEAVRVDALPRSGKCGLWFLNQPVDGRWREKPGRARRGAGGPEYSRRHEPCVQSWPYLVLESDIKGIEPLWLNFLAGLSLPIVALYSSGGKSVHALVRVNAPTKAAWDALREQIKPWLTKHGADPGVFSAVRLTRLPGCWRHGTEIPEKGEKQADGCWKMEDGTLRREPPGARYVEYDPPRLQELLYFNPGADGRAMVDL